MEIKIWQDPGNLRWFIEVDGLMDVDVGYFYSKEDAEAYAYRMFREKVVEERTVI